MAYSNQKNKNNNKKIVNPGEGGESDFQSYHIIRFKCPVLNKKITRHTKNSKVWPIQKKKIGETVPEKDLMADILYKDFKTTILKMFKELKENVEEVMKMMCEQNGNVNKEIENLKRNQK